MVLPPRLNERRVDDLVDSDGSHLVAGVSAVGHRFSQLDLTEYDLTESRFEECEFDDVTLSDALLRGSRLRDVRFQNLVATTLSAPRSTWRDVSVRQSRIGAAELFDTDLSSMVIEHSKLGYVNLRGAQLRDVLISNCTIDELDLGQSQATRVAITNCVIGTLDTTNARLSHVDLRGSEFSRIDGLPGLRGAMIDAMQLSSLAPVLAAEAGLLLG